MSGRSSLRSTATSASRLAFSVLTEPRCTASSRSTDCTAPETDLRFPAERRMRSAAWGVPRHGTARQMGREAARPDAVGRALEWALAGAPRAGHGGGDRIRRPLVCAEPLRARALRSARGDLCRRRRVVRARSESIAARSGVRRAAGCLLRACTNIRTSGRNAQTGEIWTVYSHTFSSDTVGCSAPPCWGGARREARMLSRPPAVLPSQAYTPPPPWGPAQSVPAPTGWAR